jgi:hypothetical protein
MRGTILILLIFWNCSAFGQDYSFAKDFVNGSVFLKDSSRKAGQVKWMPQQNEKLRFRESENGQTVKYAPEDILGFSADTFHFVSLYHFQAYAESYPLLGKTTIIKHTFGQVLDTGKFNIYFVLITGYDALGSALQTYPNFLFQNTQDSSLGLVAFPFLVRMKDRKYEAAKEKLFALFKDYPELKEKVKTYNQHDDFFEIINRIKAINRQ